ncbi:Putative esterase2C [gamma proteobacterium IMCC2047]|nr:Putative esterase2C [gamma proteobacterium IMCC2047]
MIIDSKPPLLIYLHGFNSSPDSFKARFLGEYLSQRGAEKRYLVPALSYQPAEALASVRQLIEKHAATAEITLIGSSLGGYYATNLAEQYGLRAVLINPAVYPYRLLKDYLGINRNYHTGEEYEMRPEYMQQLLDIEVPYISEPQRFLVLLQTADETLDYREAAEKYANAQLCIEQGGSHGFDDFEQKIPQLLEFAGFQLS